MARRVEAVVMEGRSGIAMSGTYVGMVGSAAAVGVSTHSGMATTNLAAFLSFPARPPSRAMMKFWIAFLAVSLAMFGIIAASAGDAGWVAVTLLFVLPTLVTLLILSSRFVERRRKDRVWYSLEPGMAAAWHAAWYCGRCAGTFFVQTFPLAFVKVGELIPLQEFRNALYAAGVAKNESRRPG
jgi:hypothetical protein